MACIKRCPNCPGDRDPVGPDGPTDSSIMFIGEQPGKDENRLSRPFIGRAGKEFNENYLPIAGMNRDEIYITNTVKCMHATSGKLPPEETIKSCREYHLRNELRSVQPKIVVTMGSLAYSNVDNWGVDLERQHGIPFRGKVLGHECTVFPVWHPALGLHKPEMIRELTNDFKVLREILRGTYKATPTAKKTRCSEVTNDSILVSTLGDKDRPVALDTESIPTDQGWRPYYVTYSVEEGEGYIIRAGQLDLLQLFGSLIRGRRNHVILHNAPYDIDVLLRLGIAINLRRVYDTMQHAFHLGLDQSLKTLAYRHLGLKMRDFDDVVTPYSSQRALDYLEQANSIPWPKPEPQVLKNDDGTERIYKPQSMSTKLKRFFTDLGKNPDKDIFAAINNWREKDPEGVRGLIIKLGPLPRKSIADVPFEEAMEYAVTDARATLEIYNMMKGMGYEGI